LVLMLLYHWGLALLILVMGVSRVALLLILRKRNEQLIATELAVSGQEQAILLEALSAMETVKASASQGYILARWMPRLVRRMNVYINRQRIRIASGQFMGLLQGISLATVFWVGGRAVLSERMTLGVFTAFLALQGLFMGPLESLLGAFNDLQYLSSHLLRLDDVLETPAELSGSQDPGRLQGAIELEEVSFRYTEGSPWILQKINLSIVPGEKVALVGRSGAGKSTLARLLMGMLPPTEGTIRFDGQDLRELDLTRFRQQLGVVLHDTVRANISLRNLDMPIEKIRNAAKLAQIHAVIDQLPDGYMTRLGENALTLSGGERQRICLARAIASEPSIILLDEASSSLDLETEAHVHAGLAAIGCTRIVIAHRLATVQDANRILVMQDGVIVQHGTYAQLQKVPGLFQEAILAMEGNRG
jgi:ATP-binding cassette subfamily B protein